MGEGLLNKYCCATMASIVRVDCSVCLIHFNSHEDIFVIVDIFIRISQIFALLNL